MAIFLLSPEAVHATSTQALHAPVARGDRAHLHTLQSTVGNGALTKEIFGYATAGSLADPTFGYPSWNFDELSTVAFFAIRVDYNGVLVADSNWTVWDSSTLTNLVATAHSHGVKVVVTLRNSFNDAVDFCDTLYNDSTTVLQTVNQVKLKGVDGVNIDYENQNVQCNPTTPGLQPMTTQALMVQFAKDMRAGLNNAGAGYYLSMATYSGSASANDGFFNIPQLNQYVDSFFVMAYDMDYANQGAAPLQSCSSFCMAPVSPLANYFWNDSTSMSQYVALVGGSKVILGQPYYGRVACVAGSASGPAPGPHAIATSGSVTAATYLDASAAIYAPEVVSGSYQIHRDADDPNGQDRWDTWYDTSHACWREMYWSDTTTLGVRYDLVNQDGLRGVGFWTLNYGGGASELWNSINTHFVKCTAVSLTPATQSVGATSTVTLTASATGCIAPRYMFWVQYPDQSWHVLQGWGGSSLTWTTTGYSPGTYTIHAWAAARGDMYDAVGEATVQLTPCASAAVAPASSTQPIGEVITLTASSTGCPVPRYSFWIQYPDTTWHLGQDFSGAVTYNWNTAGLAPGSYTIHAWVNTMGSGYDAFGTSTITLTGCTAATLTPATPSQDAGSTFSFTAGSTGCLGPRYAFWVQYPDQSWHFVQGFGGPTFNWSTAGLPAGTYTVHVWVNRAGSGYDAVGSATATLVACANAALSPASGSAAAGTTVSFTASSSTCSGPRYAFWVQYPDLSWHFVQGFGGPAFSWKTTGLPKGTYTIHVWVNTQGIGYDSVGSATYTLT